MDFKEKKKEETCNPFLTISRNLRSDLQGISITKSVSKTKIIEQAELKQILPVYVDDQERLYINRSSAYALGLMDTRAIMTDNVDSLVEITKMQLATIKARSNIEVIMEKITTPKKLPERPKIKVYQDNLDYFIDMAAAYSLGLVSVENFNAMADQKYHVSENLLVFLQNKYDVEYMDLGNKKEADKTMSI